jgi:uncharacterized protein YprB with RNaseH-like and TPR domain
MNTVKKIIWDIETFGLESMQDRILSIGVMDVDTEEIKIFINIEEKIILEEFWEYVIDATEMIGFNSDSFDWPYIIKRSLINNIRISNIPRTCPDLRKIVNGFWLSYDKFGKGTLRDWAQVLGEPCESCGGNEMPALFVKGDYGAIIKHNTEDLILTHKLYKRAEYCNLIK